MCAGRLPRGRVIKPEDQTGDSIFPVRHGHTEIDYAIQVTRYAPISRLNLSRNCAAPVTSYYAQKENGYALHGN